MPGLLSCSGGVAQIRSVPCGNRGAHRSAPVEAIIESSGDDINVLPDPVRSREQARRGRKRIDVAVAHEQMVVLDADRPVWSEAELEAGTNHSAPTGLVSSI